MTNTEATAPEMQPLAVIHSAVAQKIAIRRHRVEVCGGWTPIRKGDLSEARMPWSDAIPQIT